MSVSAPAASLSSAELGRLLREVDPVAVLAPSRLLRRVIKEDRAISGIGFHVPHADVYVIPAGKLLAIVERDELGWPAEPPASRVILLATPEARLAQEAPERILLRYWRLLFHARIDAALDDLEASGALSRPRLREMRQRIGPVEVEEAVRVLRQEKRLLPPEDLPAAFREGVALFLELCYFERSSLPVYFPSIEDPGRVEAIFAELVDAAALFEQTRLPGAAEPNAPAAVTEEEEAGAEAQPAAPAPATFRALCDAARLPAEQGNVVRAAVLRQRAAEAAASAGEAAQARQKARDDIDALVDRLRRALDLGDDEAQAWRATLPALLPAAARGAWSHAARLLYDLQKVCTDLERELFAVDLVEWACSLGQKPIKRPLPLQAEALVVQHLRSAAARLGRIHLQPDRRRRLSDLLREALHHREEHLRRRIRPLLASSLDEVGFVPTNQAESIARSKLIEELLDRIIERGFFNMGDLRDAISRNQLKLGDSDPIRILRGDLLLKANRKLAITLDGVYHRGEVYLRWLQRFSGLFFANFIGRWLTLFVILPFGGAFATLIFAQEVLHLATVHVHMPWPWLKPHEHHGDSETTHSGSIHLEMSGYELLAWLIGLGVFFLLLLHMPAFRGSVWTGLKQTGRLLRAVFWDLPAAFVYWAPVRAFLDSAPVAFFRRRVMRPVLIGFVAVLAWFPFSPPGGWDDLAIGVGAFALAFLFFNSRVGQRTEEAVSDWLGANWYWLRDDVLPGLLRLILQVFRDLLDYLERLFYTVDEWFRFRPGDSRLALFYKPVLGLFWFLVTYVFRILINLMIEPTVNPIKHFPAVTVGAKLIIPMIPEWHGLMTAAMAPVLGVAAAQAISGFMIVMIPGIFGFAVWEFKENWKLYRANRPRGLRPVMIGHHGETMLRLMKPGFHSGTLPKAFARLRAALRQGDARKIHKQKETLHHIDEAVRHFAERELIRLLQESRSWGGLDLEVRDVRLASNRVEIALACSSLGADALEIAFEERCGWLVAGIRSAGWLSRIDATQRRAFRVALGGFYQLAGAYLVREELEAELPGPYVIEDEGVVFYPGGDFANEEKRPLVCGVTCDRLLFSSHAIPWTEWVTAWERDRAGQGVDLAAIGGCRVLPA